MSAVATECNHNLDDCAGREQAQERLGGGAMQSGSLAAVDRSGAGVGLAADERGTVDRLREEPREMDANEKRELEDAIWRACWDCMITFDESQAAIAKYCK